MSAVEMLTARPLFPGDSDMDQLWLILCCFGPLTARQSTTLQAHPVHSAIKLPAAGEQESLRAKCKGLPRQALSFLEAALQTDPAQRATARDLLRHEFFADVDTWRTPDFVRAQEQDLAEAHARSELFHRRQQVARKGGAGGC